LIVLMSFTRPITLASLNKVFIFYLIDYLEHSFILKIKKDSRWRHLSPCFIQLVISNFLIMA
jgi:hypothetical protein